MDRQKHKRLVWRRCWRFVVVSAEGDDVLAMRSTTTSAPIVLYSKRAMEKTPFVGEIEGNVPLVMNGREVFRMAVSNSQDDIKACDGGCQHHV